MTSEKQWQRSHSSSPKTEDSQSDPKVIAVCEKYSINPILYKALLNGNTKDRMFILRFEMEIISFINSTEVDSWKLNPLNSYFRLLTHQVAEYYQLGHILLKDGVSMVIFKNNTSAINGAHGETPRDHREKLNRRRLGDIPDSPHETDETDDIQIITEAEPAQPKKIMQRSQATNGESRATENLHEPPSTQITAEEYIKKREEIFQNGADTSNHSRGFWAEKIHTAPSFQPQSMQFYPQMPYYIPPPSSQQLYGYRQTGFNRMNGGVHNNFNATPVFNPKTAGYHKRSYSGRSLQAQSDDLS